MEEVLLTGGANRFKYPPAERVPFIFHERTSINQVSSGVSPDLFRYPIVFLTSLGLVFPAPVFRSSYEIPQTYTYAPAGIPEPERRH
jgi:hypothetical protein